MKRAVAGLLMAAGLLLTLSASDCEGPNQDNTNRITGADVSEIQEWHFYSNTDNWPNVQCIFIGGVAFVTTSTRTSDADTAKSPVLIRVPEWDKDGKCPTN